MDDTLRLDLGDCDEAYILGVLDAFLEQARGYGRKVIEIRMTASMLEGLSIQRDAAGGSYKSVPVTLLDAGPEGTVEVVLGSLQ